MKNIGRYKTSIILQLMILGAGSLFSLSATTQKFLHKGDVVTISVGHLTLAWYYVPKQLYANSNQFQYRKRHCDMATYF
ncbi:hypothetical protein ACRQ5D_29190 [Mucilaginibacter sp. P25]|uniref:hypothetical protein n=1 Tax=Mucilaginibacter sp. P25 TaxID=3423945 RepID=UPI003D792485